MTQPNKKKILFVEDEANFRETLTGHLAEQYQVLEAEDGEEAIKLWVDELPDLVLLDLMLPKLDGYKVLERMRSYPDPTVARTPVVILSNLWSDKDILAAGALKISAYLVKAQTSTDDTIRIIREVLNNEAVNKK